MSNDELFQALRMFQQGAQEYATGSAIRSAAAQVKDINKIQQDEFMKRQALEETGKQLALQLGSIGAPAAQIQQAAGAIMPKQLNAPEDFFSQAAQATNPEAQKEMANAGIAFQKYLAKAPLTTAQAEQMKLGWAQLFGAQQAGAAAAGSQKLKPLTDTEVKKITDLDTELSMMQQLLRKVETNPDLVGVKNMGSLSKGVRSLVNPEFDVFRKEVEQRFDTYRQRVTGAGASEGELAILESRLPKVSDTPAMFTANMKASLAIQERIRRRTVEDLAKANRDMDKFSTAPVTAYGRQLDKLEPQIREIETAQDALSKLLSQNPNDPRIDQLRKTIRLSAKKLGI